MFMFDVETLGIESNSVILSMACIYFNPDDKPTYKELVESAFFVKLDSKFQTEHLERSVNKSTLDWWMKQADMLKKQSLIPTNFDIEPAAAIDMLKIWSQQYPRHKECLIWARGSLDQAVLGSMHRKLGQEDLFNYGRWRDVRTAVDLLTGSTNGYCDVNHPDFNTSMVLKHNPVHDCAYDIMMMLYGK